MDQVENLKKVFKDDLGVSNVYYQPPESIKLKYPCIIFKRSKIDKRYANNKGYIGRVRYMVTVIDKNPTSEITKKILELPFCSHDRFYVADNLNHDVFDLYY